jgi:hypothetical protein
VLSCCESVPPDPPWQKRPRAGLLGNIADIAQRASTRIQEALRDDDLPKLLANYDNKGLMVLAARHLKKSKRLDFESWLTRVLRNNTVPPLLEAIRNSLPEIQPQ